MDVLFVEKRTIKRTSGLIIHDKKLFARALGYLGKSRLSQNVNQLVRAANSGSLPVNIETIKALEDAVKGILWLRETFMAALDVKKQAYQMERA